MASGNMFGHQSRLYLPGGPLAHTVAFESDGDFESKVLAGIESQETKIKSLEQKHGEILKALPKDLAATLEEITKLKKVANDQQANFDAMLRQIRQFEVQMRQHVLRAYDNPIKRIQWDPELRSRFNIAVRLAVSKTQEMVPSRLRDQYKEITGKALGEDTSPGSLLIDDKLSSEIYDTLASYGIWSSFQVDRVGTQTTKYPVTTARPAANFVLTEGGTVADGSFTGASVSNVVEVIAALINVSIQLLQDAEYDVTGYVMNHFAESFSERLDYACLRADGTADATNGGMTGIFNGGTAAAADQGAGADDTVEELEFEDVTRCLLTVDPIVLQRPARWWIHPQILIRMLSIKDSNGRPIFLTALESPTPKALGSILGYPVTPSLAAPSTNTASQKVAAFGDPAGLVVGIRSDYTFDASDHFRWNTLERSFRAYGRAGVKVRRALSFAILTLGA